MRRLTLLLVVAALLVLPAQASATHAGGGGTAACSGVSPCWWVFNGQWLHMHTRAQYIWNGVDESSYSWYATRYAQADWHWGTILDLSFVNNWQYARILVQDGYYGNIGWAGLAQQGPHAARGNVWLNNTYMDQNFYSARAIACQEIGHTLGLNHSNGDCMAHSYHPGVWSSTNRPSTRTLNAINWGYQSTGH